MYALGCISKRYIHTYSNTHSKVCSSAAACRPSHSLSTLPSVTPHAFDEFVCSRQYRVHRAVCTVPRRGCEHAKAPAVIWMLAHRRSQRPGCDIKLQALPLVGPPAWVVSSEVEPLLAAAARRRPLVSQQRRSRLRLRQLTAGSPAKGRQACCASKPWHGALWLNALPSPSGTYHAVPEACACPRGELDWSIASPPASKQREGWLMSVGVCCPGLCRTPRVFPPRPRWPNPRRRTPQPGRASPGSPDMLKRGVAVALRLSSGASVRGRADCAKRLRRG